MNKFVYPLLALFLAGGLAVTQSAAAMDDMDKGAMEQDKGSMTKQDKMEPGAMKQDTMGKGDMKKKTTHKKVRKHDKKQDRMMEDKMEQGSMDNK